MGVEDYYFPEQKHSRQAILEQQKKFREIIGNRSNGRVEESAALYRI